MKTTLKKYSLILSSQKNIINTAAKHFTMPFLFIGILAPIITNAAIIYPFQLPTNIQACINNQTCAVNNVSLMDYNNASMFEYFDIANNSTGKLIKYNLISSSETIADVSTDFSGSIWLQTSDQYNLTKPTHDFTLYIDQISPIPSFFPATSTINLSLTTTDLLNGRGFTSADFDINSGSLITDTLPILCAAEGCGNNAFFNLIYLKYISDGATASLLPFLNAEDKRSILYSQRSFFNTSDLSSFPFFEEHVFAVQAVPIPAAIWIFGSGLMGLISFAFRKK